MDGSSSCAGRSAAVAVYSVAFWPSKTGVTQQQVQTLNGHESGVLAMSLARLL